MCMMPLWVILLSTLRVNPVLFRTKILSLVSQINPHTCHSLQPCPLIVIVQTLLTLVKIFMVEYSQNKAYPNCFFKWNLHCYFACIQGQCIFLFPSTDCNVPSTAQIVMLAPPGLTSSLIFIVGCRRQLLTDGEVYMVQNPYIVPDQRAFHLLQYVGNKGPKAPTMLLQCLVEEPLHQGHMYLAARLLGETKKGKPIQYVLPGALYSC